MKQPKSGVTYPNRWRLRLGVQECESPILSLLPGQYKPTRCPKELQLADFECFMRPIDARLLLRGQREGASFAIRKQRIG